MGYDMTNSSKDESKNYFRSNIWGMGQLRAAMKMAGVLDFEAEAPKNPAYNEDRNEEEDEDNFVSSMILDYRSENPALVPIQKFCSNDGWHVTPDECKLIADGLSKLLINNTSIKFIDRWDGLEKDVNREHVQDFADYCKFSADHDGFRVY